MRRNCWFDRRDFLRLTAASVGAGFLASSPLVMAATVPSIRAIAFDAFPVFDPRPITALARTLFPEKGEMLANIWTTKLFGYTWLETAAGRYENFETLAGSSLQFAADSIGLDLSKQSRMEFVEAYFHLTAWPDVKPALARLRAARIRLVFLSNLSEAMLRANMRNAGIEEYFEASLSTDRVRQFKPAPAAYRMAMDALGLPKEVIGFVAFGGWDAVGATWFGYRTAWVNRSGAATEGLEPKPAIVSATMDGVLALAGIA